MKCNNKKCGAYDEMYSDNCKNQMFPKYCYVKIIQDLEYENKKFKEQLKTQSPETIDFAVYLSGHNEDTVKQMYDDWKKGV